MAETLQVVWLDGTQGGGATSRSSGGGSPSTPKEPAKEQAKAKADAKTTGPKASDTDSIKGLLQDTAEMLGFGRLAKITTTLADSFGSLDDYVSKLSGRDIPAPQAVSQSQGPQIPQAFDADELVTPQDSSGGTDPTKLLGAVSKGAKLEKIIPSLSRGPAAAEAAASTAGAATTASEGAAVTGAAASTAAEGAAVAGASVEGLAGAAAAAGPALAGVAAVAIPLTIALAAVVAGVAAFKMGLDQAYRDIEALEGFSGELSSANAMAEVRSMMGEMERAQRLGPQLAELSDITSRGQEAMYDIVTELMAAFLDYAEEMKPFIEACIIAAKITAAGIPLIKEEIELMISLFNPLAAMMMGLKDPFSEGLDAIEAIKKFTKATVDALTEKPEDAPVDDPFIRDFFNGVRGLGNPPPPPMPGPPGPPAPNPPGFF